MTPAFFGGWGGVSFKAGKIKSADMMPMSLIAETLSSGWAWTVSRTNAVTADMKVCAV